MSENACEALQRAVCFCVIAATTGCTLVLDFDDYRLDDQPRMTFDRGSDTPQIGNSTNGNAYEDACPRGQALMGFAGQLGDGGGFTDVPVQIQGKCGIVSLSDDAPFVVTVSNGATLPPHGDGPPTGPWALSCLPDQVVVGFGGRFGAILDQLLLRCAPLIVSDDGTAVSIGAITETEATAGQGGSPFDPVDCPMGQVATVSRIRAGAYVDAFAFGCSTPKVTY